jgi:tyrosine-protein phosphatase OCA6
MPTATPVDPLQLIPAQPAGTLYPPYRYATVAAGLHRGAYPRARNLPFLRTLRLATLLSLTPEPLAPEAAAWCAAAGVACVHVRVEKPKEDAITLSFARLNQVGLFFLVCLVHF